MNLGAFSMSLAVADLTASREFYELLGFEVLGGDADGGWLILRNGQTTLGLFADMFTDNILTFNPGMGDDMKPDPDAQDIRDIHERLTAAGVAMDYAAPGMDAPEDPMGGAHGTAANFTVTDPDGNQILVDQFDLSNLPD